MDAAFAAEMRGAGAVSVLKWSNAPGDRYGIHTHSYRKVLCCLAGSIVFRVAGHDVEFVPGSRLTIEARSEHSARVGDRGVCCAEAHLD